MNYKAGISPKDKNFFMSKEKTEEIKSLTEKEQIVEYDSVRKDIAKAVNTNSDDSKKLMLNDFEYLRGHMMTAIEAGQEAITDLLELARSSQHPRAYEVLSLMIKTILEGNKQLIEAHKDKREIETMKEPEQAQAQTVNNNVFVGSTTELHKLLKQLKSQ